MPGTTRYSATFDRTYEEDDRAKPSSPQNARRPRSQSWQANTGLDGRQYTPFASRSPATRSSSTDNNLNKSTEHIPTRTAKTSVKAHNNPFQFVKVGTCPLYKKAEEQLKKAKEIKKPDVLKEEEEEWQSNLDSWKSRRRKMSEDVFRRQEELKLLELEEQIAQVSNKKTKTFSEMVESRATRGRALSLCLLTSPLEFQNWEFENKSHKNGSCSFTDESGENSTVNSEDEGVSIRGRLGETKHNENELNHRTNGNAHIEQNGSKLDTQNGNCNQLSSTVQTKPKENSYIDSGLESISSSHRAGDTPDSGSDFSQDSNSSMDCDSPRNVNVLEEFSTKSSQLSEGRETTVNLKLDEKGQDFGFTFLGGKDEGQVIIASILEGSKAELSDMHLGDRIITIDGCDVSSKKHIEIAALMQKGREKGQISLLLWRHCKATEDTKFSAKENHNKVIAEENLNAKLYEKSIESENEMYVDDFEELKKQSELLALNKKSDAASTNAQAKSKGNLSSNKDAISLKTSSAEGSTAPILNINTSNSAVEVKNEQKTDINSVISNENQKKNIIKVKRVRRKGVYVLNVDSNQISQDGISTNSLFPLSPVTELPSPADETKTVSSTLSSVNTLPDFISQNGINEETKQNDTEIKPDIPIVQENNSVASSLSKSENFNSTAAHTNLKIVKHIESKFQINTEKETEDAKVPSSTIKNKSSPEEKSKSQSVPKKNKSSKLKKEAASENISTSSESSKEHSPALIADVTTSETMIQEKTLSELKPLPTLKNKESYIETVVIPKSVENSLISSKNTFIPPASEVITASNCTSSQSLVVTTNSEEISTAGKQATISTTEDIKSSKTVQKKVITKPKERNITSSKNTCIPPASEVVTASNNSGVQSLMVTNSEETCTADKQTTTSATENIIPKKTAQKKIIAKPKGCTPLKNSGTLADTTLIEIYSTKAQNPSSKMEKQELICSKNETAVSSMKEENHVYMNGNIDLSQVLKTLPEKEETPISCPSSNKVRDLALKFGEKKPYSSSESPILPKRNIKPPKTCLSEKSKSTKIENAKMKENCVGQFSGSPSTVVSESSFSNTFLDSSSKHKNLPIQDKQQVEAEIKDETTIASPKRQVEKKTSISSSMNESETLSIVNATENKLKKGLKTPPLSPESKLDSEDKTVVPSFKKENSIHQNSSATPQVLQETSVSSVSSPTESIDERTKTKNEKIITLNPERKLKIMAKNQTVAAQLKKDNNDEQVPLHSQQIANDTLSSAVLNASDSPSSKSPVKEIKSKKERKTISVSQDKQEKTAAKNETKVSPPTRVINFFKCPK